MRTIISILLFLAITVICNFNLAIASTKILPPPKKISDHVYAWIGPLEGPSKENHGYRMNMAFVVGNNAVAVIDTGYTEAIANEMLAHIKEITDTPVKYAINSNSQPHRFMGNTVFQKAGVTIISHKKSAERMAAQSGNFAGAIERILELPKNSVKLPKAPDQAIDQETRLDLGGVTLHINNYGAAHTPASLVIAIPEDKIVYAGDILYSGRLLAVLADSNVKSWIDVFDKLETYGDVTFIPGHGEPAPLKAFDNSTRQYLNLLLTHMDKMVDEGVDLQDAINRLDQSAYSKLVNFEELSGRNASWTYLQREQAAFE